MSANEQKEKIKTKAILKAPVSSMQDAVPSTSKKPKGAKFDENNIKATLHPSEKDYGHMKIEEPKTPFRYSDSELDSLNQLDPAVLAEKLLLVQEFPRDLEGMASDSDSDAECMIEKSTEKSQFEFKRRMHYDEAQALKLGRKLLEEEEEEEEDGVDEYEKGQHQIGRNHCQNHNEGKTCDHDGCSSKDTSISGKCSCKPNCD